MTNRHAARTAAGILMALCAACGGPPNPFEAAAAPPPPPTSEQFPRAGTNGRTLDEGLARLPEDLRPAAKAWIDDLPDADLGLLTADELVENVTAAFQARREMPWGPAVPDDLFRHYVMPHRGSQEPLRRWRAAFYRLLSPWVRPCRTLREAALAVNVWVAAQAKFVTSEARDQGPLETLRRGAGRCEELTILTLCAARSVGIPARPCWTPWWTTMDNNHAWVEVWTGDDADGPGRGWHFLGAAEPAPDLDQAWFKDTAARAGLVQSVCYGRPSALPESLEQTGPGYAMLNTTGVYGRPVRVSIRLSGMEAVRVPVTLSAFNFGAFRTLSERTSDAEGRAVFWVGPGDYLLCVGTDAPRAVMVVHAGPAEEAAEVVVPLDAGEMPPETFWLRFPPPPAAAAGTAGAERTPAFDPAVLGPPPPARGTICAAAPYDPAKPDPDLESRLGAAEAGALRDNLSRSGLNWTAWSAALKSADPDVVATAREWLGRLETFDLLAMQISDIEDHATCDTVLRKVPWGTALSSDWIRDAVREPRLGPLMPVGAWRRELHRTLEGTLAPTPDATAAKLGEWLRARVRVTDASDYFGGLATPLAVLRVGRGRRKEVAALGVAALRSLCIPARLMRDLEGVEYRSPDGWKPFDVGLPPVMGAGAPKTAAELVEIPARITVRGLPAEYSESWGVSYWRAGRWDPVEPGRFPIEVEPTGDGATLRLPPGQYWVTGGVRNRNGDVWVHARPLTVVPRKPGMTPLSVRWSLDIPLSERPAGSRLMRPLTRLNDIALQGLDGRPSTIRFGADQPLRGVVYFSPDQEPSRRLLAALSERRDAWRQAGVELTAVASSGHDAAAWEAFRASGGMAWDVGIDASGALASALGLPLSKDLNRPNALPAVVFLNGDGSPLYSNEGYNLEIPNELDEAIREVTPDRPPPR